MTLRSFTVSVKDKHDTQRPVGGDIIVARLIDRASNRIAAEGHVVDNTDGSYYVSYVPTRCGAELSLRVTVNGTLTLSLRLSLPHTCPEPGPRPMTEPESMPKPKPKA